MSKISDIFELENIGYISSIYIMDIYRATLHRLPAHLLEDAHSIRQLHYQLRYGPFCA